MSESSTRDRERDLILGPGEYANILDETKGHVTVWVGPSKASLSQTDRPVTWDPKQRRFVPCKLEESILTFPFAEKGSYIVLHNPTLVRDSSDLVHPNQGSNSVAKLDYGNKINIEGPQTFALFPGQFAETLPGHRMRSNQYLIVRVYDEEAAKENWGKATIKLQKKEGDKTPEPTEEEKAKALGAMPDLTMGRLLIIEGTKVSFYIPPTGIEVIDESSKYVRDAITLERLEYCILLDEDGNKRYVTGPAVVFPQPTETFVEKSGSRKFKAIELNELMGIYVKVIADYEENGTAYKAGDELFITGKDQKIYYPRPEHAIVKYGDQMVSYAIAIPAGEARYVLNRKTGDIDLKRGPAMLLPDPRTEVVVRRILSPKQVELWFPGNAEAKAYNNALSDISSREDNAMAYISEKSLGRNVAMATSMRTGKLQTLDETETYGLAATEELKRSNKFTPPRTVTLDTKYEGAVSIDVWPGYAVQVVSRTGERKVIVGPQVYLLAYDETLEKMSFSTGTPKNDDKLKSDVYLRVLHNTISDLIKVETKDLCPIDILVSYRVNFEENETLWFNVENYVKFLTDHVRSLLRNKVKQIGIEQFYGDSITTIRDTILGVHPETSEPRPGLTFIENGMRVYDLEVLGINIENDEISGLLEDSQHEAVSQRLMVEQKQNELVTTQKTEKINREIEEAKTETFRNKLKLQIGNYELQLQAGLTDLKIKAEVEKQRMLDVSTKQNIELEIETKRLEQDKARDQQALELANQKLEQTIRELKEETSSTIAKAEAVSPALIAVLQDFTDKELATKLAENLSFAAMLGGTSIVDVAQKLLGGAISPELLKNLNLHLHNK